MPFTITVPPGHPAESVEHTILGPEDLVAGLEPILGELDRLRHRMAKLESLPAPQTESDPARTNRVRYWADRELEITEASARAWMETAAQNQRNTDYYRGLVVKIGEMFGQEAKTQDDGGISEDVLCAKVPELVAKAVVDAKRYHSLGAAVDSAKLGLGKLNPIVAVDARRYRALRYLLLKHKVISLHSGSNGVHVFELVTASADRLPLAKGANLDEAIGHLPYPVDEE